MQLWNVAALLILQCWIPLTTCNKLGSILDASSLSSYRTVQFNGTEHRVYSIPEEEVEFAEPRIAFVESCWSIRYSNLYQKYQLILPIQIDANTMGKSGTRVTIKELKTKADSSLTNKDAEVMTMALLEDSSDAGLQFLCDTFVRCELLRDEIASNPEDVWPAIRFVAIGSVGKNTVRFDAVGSASLPKMSCSPNVWVVFQRRVDDSLSFAQNWDAYVKGFGSPNSNYWMGLDQLFAMTVTSSGYPDNPSSSRCELRIETEDLNGKSYFGEYKHFEVLGPHENYRLRVGLEVSGSPFKEFVATHHEKPFSTYDKDNDEDVGKSCSKVSGFGGWWYNACHSLNLNGAYTTDKNMTSDQAYNSANIGGKFVPMKSTVMKFKCS